MNQIKEINEYTILYSGQKLDEDLARQIAYEDNQFCEVVFTKTDKNAAYKDCAPCEVVFLHNSKLWSFNYDRYISHYGNGESTFYDCVIQEVEYYEEEVKTVVKGYRAV